MQKRSLCLVFEKCTYVHIGELYWSYIVFSIATEEPDMHQVQDVCDKIIYLSAKADHGSFSFCYFVGFLLNIHQSMNCCSAAYQILCVCVCVCVCTSIFILKHSVLQPLFTSLFPVVGWIENKVLIRISITCMYAPKLLPARHLFFCLFGFFSLFLLLSLSLSSLCQCCLLLTMVSGPRHDFRKNSYHLHSLSQ